MDNLIVKFWKINCYKYFSNIQIVLAFQTHLIQSVSNRSSEVLMVEGLLFNFQSVLHIGTNLIGSNWTIPQHRKELPD